MSRNMTSFNLQGLIVLLLAAALFLTSIINTCNAKRSEHCGSGREGIPDQTETMARSKRDDAGSGDDDRNRGIVGGTARKLGKPKRKTNAHHSPKKGPNSSPTPGTIPYPRPSPIPEPTPSPIPDPPSPTPSPMPSSPCPTPEPKPSPEPEPSTSYPPPPVPTTVFNVLDFGGQGDGVSDDTKAFQLAWAAACKMAESTLLVPSAYKFLVGPISFSGPYCQSGIVFQLDGTIIAPIGSKAWNSGFLQWLEFTKLKSITIQGGGTVEGRGTVWWGNMQTFDETVTTEKAIGMPHIKPTVLRFYGSYNVTVTGITIQNSPQCHLKFDACDGVQVSNITISSPGDSPNTDGIHLQNSKNVLIRNSQLSCGDDCVSIQTGCSNIDIHEVNCGPGHGISIGGLGGDNTKACVSNVTVHDVNLRGTLTGVRIKTWQGGSGAVKNIRFSNIQVEEVKIPIVIDQYYCDRSSCKNQSSAVALSNIMYENIQGSFTVKPVHLACSDSVPCTDISLTDLELSPLQEHYHMFDPFCWNAHGQLHPPILPPISCLDTKKSKGGQMYVAPVPISC